MEPAVPLWTGFAGRGAELAMLGERLRAAVSGRGCTVLVAGDAGIGKTRLVSELAGQARAVGVLVLRGRCIELVGSGLPYLPFVTALRGHCDVLGEEAPGGSRSPGRDGADRQLRLFERIRAGLGQLAATAPVVLVIEDLHWADGSTLDLVSFLANSIGENRILLVATYRNDGTGIVDPGRRVVIELVRSRAASLLELGPLSRQELAACLGEVDALPPDVADAVFARSAGNPFFAEELLAAGRRGERELPRLLRDALLQRIAGLDTDTRAMLRVAAAAGRDVSYGLLATVLATPEHLLRESLRRAVEHQILVIDQPAALYRFRHALLADAVYTTLLPGEREDVHGRLARALDNDPWLAAPGSVAGELAEHWAAANRPTEALRASLQAARDAEARSGLTEAVRHLRRALALWQDVPAADSLTGTRLPVLLAWTAELADLTGDGRWAADLVRQAIGLVEPDGGPEQLALLYERFSAYLLPTGDRAGGLAASRRAVGLVPADPPSPERARVLATLGNALMLSWRHAESEQVCREALRAAEATGDDRPTVRALGVLAIDLCYLGHPTEAVVTAQDACKRAGADGTAREVAHSYAHLCEVLVAAGQPAEAARTALDGLAAARRLGVERSFGVLLATYAAEALLETGDWTRAGEVLAEHPCSEVSFWTHYPHLVRAQLATGRGDFAAARRHLDAGSRAAREPTSAPRYARQVAELALWQGEPASAARAVDEGLRGSAGDQSAFHRVRFGALGLRAEAARTAQPGTRRDAAALRASRRRADRLLTEALRSATVAASVTPDAHAWQAVAVAEHGRATGSSCPLQWTDAVTAWDLLDRPYLAAYCRWRAAEAHLPAGVSAVEAVGFARHAHRVARRLGARPLQHELELLAMRARLDLAGPGAAAERRPPHGLTPREGEVLELLTRGYTNRQIAAEFTISVKTASVHVTNILRKFGVASRIEAAAIGQRLSG